MALVSVHICSGCEPNSRVQCAPIVSVLRSCYRLHSKVADSLACLSTEPPPQSIQTILFRPLPFYHDIVSCHGDKEISPSGFYQSQLVPVVGDHLLSVYTWTDWVIVIIISSLLMSCVQSVNRHREKGHQ